MVRAMFHLLRRGAFWAVLLAADAAHAVTDEAIGTYQGESVKNFGRGSQGLWATAKQYAADLDITPARALVGLGVVGAVFTLSKNKRLFHWGVVAAISYALIALGALAMVKGWPSMN